MRISIFGLGYVGCISIGCLAKNGYQVIGVDIDKNKINLINSGKATVIEKDIDEIISKYYNKKSISATLDYEEAVINSDVSIICVGTPTCSETGHLNLEYVYKVAEQIGNALKNKKSFHTVVIRSTVLPGTNHKVGNIISKNSNKKLNINFGIVSNPEFLREGTAVEDYFNPPFTLLASKNNKSLKIMKNVYEAINSPIVETQIEVAEIIKYVNNTYHALKISFSNEIGNICKSMNIDSHDVMDIFCMDKKLNISSAYFKPGFAYGGSCLPKDLRGLESLAKIKNIKTPIINSINETNENQKNIVINRIVKYKKKNIGIIGLSFKKGTDDLRFSPSIDIVKYLFKKGYNIKIWDEFVRKSKIIGSNKNYINNLIPNIYELITDNAKTVIDESEVILVTQKHQIIIKLLEKNKDKIIIDVGRIFKKQSEKNYWGICW